jgi:hypothetical protein
VRKFSPIVVNKKTSKDGFQTLPGVSDKKTRVLLERPHTEKPRARSIPERKLPPIFLKTYFIS